MDPFPPVHSTAPGGAQRRTPLRVQVAYSCTNPNTIELRIPHYDQSYVDHIKKLPYNLRKWNSTERAWEIPANAYNRVHQHMGAKQFLLDALPAAPGGNAGASGSPATPNRTVGHPVVGAAAVAQSAAGSSRLAGTPATPAAPATPVRPAAPLATPNTAPTAPATPSSSRRPNTAQQQQQQGPRLLPDAEVDRLIHARVPRDLWEWLKSYQQDGVKFAVKHGGRMLLADAPGLGKTAVAIAVALCYPDDWPLLVVVPASMRDKWAQEIRKRVPQDRLPPPELFWTPGTGAKLAELLSKTPNPCDIQRHILITTYQLVQQLPPHAQKRYRFVICDESHSLKKDSKRTQFMSPLVKKAPRALLLSGTPVTSRPIECYFQVDMLCPGLLGTFHQFGQKYCVDPNDTQPQHNQTPYPQDPYRGANKARMGELEQILSHSVMLRRTKEMIQDEVPAKVRKRLPITVTSEAPARMKALLDKLRARGLEQTDPRMQSAITWYWRVTGFAKAIPVMSMLTRHLLQLDEHRSEAAQAATTAAAAASEADAAAQAEAGKDDRSSSGAKGKQPLSGAGASSSKRRKVEGDQQQVDGEEGPDSSSDDDEEEGACAARTAAAAAAGQAVQAAPEPQSLKVLVFAHHKQVMNVLEEGLAEGLGAGGYIRIDGSTPSGQRQPLVDRFQRDPGCRVALLSMLAAGEGLTLTAAQAVLFAELPWTPATITQCEDRAHRIGQTAELQVFYAVAAGTSDDGVWGNLHNKLNVVDVVLDGWRGRGGGGSGQFTRAGQSTWAAAGQAAAAAAAAVLPLPAQHQEQHHHRQHQQQEQQQGGGVQPNGPPLVDLIMTESESEGEREAGKAPAAGCAAGRGRAGGSSSHGRPATSKYVPLVDLTDD